MSCPEMQDWIHGYVDGELDLVKAAAVEEHLRTCRVCSTAYAGSRHIRSTLRAESLHYSAPAHLNRRILASVRKAAAAETRRPVISWRWAVVFLSLAVVGVVAWVIVRTLVHSSTEDLLAGEIVSAHVRSLMADHLTDVASSDQHTVKPWFNGRLDFSPQVKDLVSSGFPLVGGRLDYIHGRPAATLIYQRRKHFINLFIWPERETSDTPPVSISRRGYNLIHWTHAGMIYWTISDLARSELEQFVRLQRED